MTAVPEYIQTHLEVAKAVTPTSTDVELVFVELPEPETGATVAALTSRDLVEPFVLIKLKEHGPYTYAALWAESWSATMSPPKGVNFDSPEQLQDWASKRLDELYAQYGPSLSKWPEDTKETVLFFIFMDKDNQVAAQIPFKRENGTITWGEPDWMVEGDGKVMKGTLPRAVRALIGIKG